MNSCWERYLFYETRAMSLENTIFIIQILNEHVEVSSSSPNNLFLFQKKLENYYTKKQKKNNNSSSSSSIRILERVLQRHKHELIAIEMDFRHNYATFSQLVAAIKPSALLLTQNQDPSSIRHEMFLEKIATEPRKFFNKANVHSSLQALERILSGIRKEMYLLSISKSSMMENNNQIFENIYLSHTIIKFLTPLELLTLGSTSKIMLYSKDFGDLLLFENILKSRFFKAKYDLISIERTLVDDQSNSNNYSSSSNEELRDCLTSQRNVAKFISFLFKHFLNREDIYNTIFNEVTSSLGAVKKNYFPIDQDIL